MPIIESVIDHYWPLFLVSVSITSGMCNQYFTKCTNNVISCDYNILIASLIRIIIEKMLIFIARIRNQKVGIISDQYQFLVHIKSNYWFIGTSVKFCISASIVQSSVEMVCSKILQFNYKYKHYLERLTM